MFSKGSWRRDANLCTSSRRVVDKPKTILTLAACHFVVHEKRGFEKLRPNTERPCPKTDFTCSTETFREPVLAQLASGLRYLLNCDALYVVYY